MSYSAKLAQSDSYPWPSPSDAHLVNQGRSSRQPNQAGHDRPVRNEANILLGINTKSDPKQK